MGPFQAVARHASSTSHHDDESSLSMIGALPDHHDAEQAHFLPQRRPSADLIITPVDYEEPDHDPIELTHLQRSVEQRIENQGAGIKPTNNFRSSSESSRSSDASSSPSQNWVVRCLRGCRMKRSAPGKTPFGRKCWSPITSLQSKVSESMRHSRLHGWRMGVLFGICSSMAILCFNVAILVLLAYTNEGFENGFAQPFSYAPSTLTRLVVGFHVLINALSTILLAASNYTMQVIASPTREDIDKAHWLGEWFDIGVLSIWNLKRIPRSRLAICTLLGLSSIPLHLFYNSAVIYIATTNQYQVFFLDANSSEWNHVSTNSSFEEVANIQWPSKYDTALVNYGDLYLGIDLFAAEFVNGTPNMTVTWPTNVTWPTEFNGSKSFIQNFNITSGWQNLTYPWNVTAQDTWAKHAHVVKGFARKIAPRDRIIFVFTFIVIVVVCNALKLSIMLFVLVLEKSEFIVTLGDSAASFLGHPEPLTQGMSVSPRRSVISNVRRRLGRSQNDKRVTRLESGEPNVWRKQWHPYLPPIHTLGYQSMGTFFLVVITLISGMMCAAGASIRPIAWGASSDLILGRFSITPQNTVLIAWLANAPQLVLSVFYLSINSECTSMAGAYEWNHMATARKGLRVTKPEKHQRNTYFLQLPYRWSLPLAALSGTLHWLMSQSIFLVRIDTYDRDGKLVGAAEGSRMGCGVSGVSMLVLSITFLIVIGTGFWMSRRLLRLRIPFAASCSLVISAACHAPESEVEPQSEKIRWGVVAERMFEGEAHCALSSGPVERPKVGERYL